MFFISIFLLECLHFTPLKNLFLASVYMYVYKYIYIYCIYVCTHTKLHLYTSFQFHCVLHSTFATHTLLLLTTTKYKLPTPQSLSMNVAPPCDQDHVKKLVVLYCISTQNSFSFKCVTTLLHNHWSPLNKYAFNNWGNTNLNSHKWQRSAQILKITLHSGWLPCPNMCSSQHHVWSR